MESLVPFDQLIQELIGGSLHRHSFRAWEMELLVDFAQCGVRGPARGNLLRRYQKTVRQQFLAGNEAPLRLSEFLEREQMPQQPRSLSSELPALSSK
jgi:hypothetical protein